jgi:3-phosphoglycerate kinase
MPIKNLVRNVKQAVRTNAIPYNYVVGGKDSGMNFNVKLSLDPDFKKTILKGVGIFSFALASGIATGIVVAEARKNNRK